MKKFIVIFSCILLVVGIALGIVGFAAGGRPGTLYAEGSNLVYHTRNDSVTLGTAPFWWPSDQRFSIGWGSGWSPQDEQHADNDGTITTPGTGGTNVTRYAVPTQSASAVRKVDIHITAGHIVLKTGDEPSLTVDGRLAAVSTFDADDGEWKIEAIHDGFSSRGDRFWWDGEDFTTTYTIVLPESFEELELQVDMGDVTSETFTLEEAKYQTDMGNITIDGLFAAKASFDASMGAITVRDFEGDNCELDVNMGSIKFWGTVYEGMDVSCEMGSVKAVLPRPDEYSWDAEVGMGSISIDGHSATGFGSSSEGGHDALPHFELDCGMGSINISFE